MKTGSFLGLALVVALVLTGCIPRGSITRASDAASEPPSSSPSEPPTSELATGDPSFTEPPPADEGNLAFGDTYTYTDDVSISVSAPAPFTPSAFAAGADQPANLLFTLTITNDSSDNMEPLTYSQVSSGGVEATAIFDSGNPAGNIGTPPQTVILPGGSITWLEAYSVADPASVVFQIMPAFDYNPAIFTNVP